MPAPTVVGVGALRSLGSGVQTADVAFPTEAKQADDLAILCVESSGPTSSNVSLDPGQTGGFEPIVAPISVEGVALTRTVLQIYIARLTGSNPQTPSLTSSDTSNHWVANITVIRGVPLGVIASNVNGNVGTKSTESTSCTFPTVTTDGPDNLVVGIASRNDDSNAVSWSDIANAALTGITKHYDGGTNLGNGGGLCIWSGTKATQGSTGSTTSTVVNSTNALATLAFPSRVVAIMNGTTALTFGGAGNLTAGSATGAISGSTSLSFGQSGTLGAIKYASGSTTLTFGQSGSLSSPVYRSGTTTLSFDSSATLNIIANLQGSTGLSFGQQAQLGAIANIVGQSGITFTASAVAGTIANIAGSTGIVFTGFAQTMASAQLSGSTGLSFTASGSLGAAPQYAGVATLTFACQGLLHAQVFISGSTSITFGAGSYTYTPSPGRIVLKRRDEGSAVAIRPIATRSAESI